MDVLSFHMNLLRVLNKCIEMNSDINYIHLRECHWVLPQFLSMVYINKYKYVKN